MSADLGVLKKEHLKAVLTNSEQALEKERVFALKIHLQFGALMCMFGRNITMNTHPAGLAALRRGYFERGIVDHAN
jgi:hypothetical protein